MATKFVPPNAPVRWLVTHVASGTTREVVAQTAFAAVQAAGWNFSVATAEQVRA